LDTFCGLSYVENECIKGYARLEIIDIVEGWEMLMMDAIMYFLNMERCGCDCCGYVETS
jgi:hypothetical protein